jgi:hypothetical protein
VHAAMGAHGRGGGLAESVQDSDGVGLVHQYWHLCLAGPAEVGGLLVGGQSPAEPNCATTGRARTSSSCWPSGVSKGHRCGRVTRSVRRDRCVGWPGWARGDRIRKRNS